MLTRVERNGARRAVSFSSVRELHRRSTKTGSATRIVGRSRKYSQDIECLSSKDGDIPRTRGNIGSDYGEGFTAFRGRSLEGISMDVDTLNESLKVQGAERMKFAMYPDQAFGLIYDFDVFVDVKHMKCLAWDKVADVYGYPKFDFDGRPHSHIDEMMAEKVILYVFKWTTDIKEARAIVYDYNQILIQTLLNHGRLMPDGAHDWLKLVGEFQIPCSLVSFFDRNTVESVLTNLGIQSNFAAVISAEDEVENRSQAYLKACIELQRPPEQCAVFCTTVESITAAHNCTMRAVALVGQCTAPQLSNADLTILNFLELTIYNLRRLFANKGNEFMDLKKGKGYDTMDEKPQIRNATFPDE